MKFKSLDIHEKQCAEIKEALLKQKNVFLIGKKNSPHTHLTRNKNYKDNQKLIDTSPFKSILEIDPIKKTALVEPGVTMQQLLKACLSFKLMPLVTPEFKNITVGGAIMGAALESSSHEWGQFNNTCKSYKILLGSGEIIKASNEENIDLFHAISSSYGTLGILLLVEIELQTAPDFIEVTFQELKDKNLFFENFNQILTNQDRPSFLEAILYSPHHCLIIQGEKRSKAELTKSTKITKVYPWDKWFYKKIIERKSLNPLALSVEDYIFRFDRGAFWMGHYLSSFKWLISYIFNRNKFESQTQAFKSSPFFDRLISFFIGPFLSASNLYKKLHNLSERWFRNTFVVQDLYVPIEKLRIFLTQIENNYPIYPLWLCPVKVTKEEELLSPHFVKNCDFVVDVGIYGLANSNITPIEATKFLEDKLKENGGRKMFYTHSYYNQEDLKNIYDLEKFSFIRKKYHAESVFIDFPRKVL